MPIITHVAPEPHTRDGFFFATNNPYQLNGPRDFSEIRCVPQTTDLYVKIDFPGVVKDSITLNVDPTKKAVFVNGDAPREHEHDSSGRKYGTTTGLACHCCEISNIDCVVGDGVVRLILSKKKLDHLPPPPTSYEEALFMATILARSPMLREQLENHPEVTPNPGGHPLAHLRGINPSGHTDPLNPAFTGPDIIPHPSVLEGPEMAYETKQLEGGGMFMRIDMPGVPRRNFTVEVDEDRNVTVFGLAPPKMFDTNGRVYGGKVAIVPEGYDCRLIKKITKHGVLRIIIPASP